MEENKKAIYLGLATAGVLLGGYVIYKWATSAPKEKVSDIADKLEKANLTEVKKGEKGQLDSQYFLSLLQFVGQETRLRTRDLRQHGYEERRKHYQSKEWEKYKGSIKKIIEHEDITAQAVVKEVIQELNINLDEFSTTHQAMASNPATAEFVMAAQ